MTIGIMAALHDEIAGLLAMIAGQTGTSVETIGKREFYSGVVEGRPCVLVLSGIGKVAAASTATLLIHRFNVSEIVFSGLAGGLAPHVNVGDIVVADRLMQHDMDARPLFPRFEIPLTGIIEFAAPVDQRERLHQMASDFLRNELQQTIAPAMIDAFQLHQPTVHVGTIASGDQFIGSIHASDQLRSLLPGVVAVEMEGAAVAQVCHDNNLPYGIIRTISDRADASAPVNFTQFLSAVASKYSAAILYNYVRQASV